MGVFVTLYFVDVGDMLISIDGIGFDVKIVVQIVAIVALSLRNFIFPFNLV